VVKRRKRITKSLEENLRRRNIIRRKSITKSTTKALPVVI
jgi:hypothetical protein